MVVCPTYLKVEPRPLLFPDNETQTTAADKTEIEVLEAVEFVIIERIPGKTCRDIASISPAAADGLRRGLGCIIEKGGRLNRISSEHRSCLFY